HLGVPMVAMLDLARSGAWLTRERVRLIALAVLAPSAIGFLYLVVTAHGVIDTLGRPLGTDFSNVYAAGTYMLDGAPAAPFDPPRQYAREQAIFGAATPFYGWHYPPFFLFVAAALALMPYGLALAVWQAVTFALYLWAIAAIVRFAFVHPPLQGEGSAARSAAQGGASDVATAPPGRLRRPPSPSRGG